MAIKYYCNSCKKEINNDEHDELYELCTACFIKSDLACEYMILYKGQIFGIMCNNESNKSKYNQLCQITHPNKYNRISGCSHKTKISDPNRTGFKLVFI